MAEASTWPAARAAKPVAAAAVVPGAAAAPRQASARRGFGALGIRNKLLVMVLLPLLVVLPLLGLILLVWVDRAFDQLLVTKVRSDLAVARGYFERVLGEVGASTRAVAESRALHEALAAPPGDIAALLNRLGRRERLDFLSLRAVDGTVIATDSGPAAETGAPASNTLRAAARRSIAAGTQDIDRSSVEVLTLDQLAALAPALRARVAVALVATRNAAPTERAREDRAMVLLSRYAVRDAAGRLLGQVQGGLLLNHNLPFIDHVNAIVYPDGALPYGSRGTATLFLDDVRISTNVRLFGPESEERAIGTRVSQSVRDSVLGRGQTWLDRAFVVNDWYVSAYEPVTDGRGARVGMLYVGFLEAPFTRVKVAALVGIGLVFVAVMLVAAVVSLRWAHAIFRPLEQMEATMRRVESGALDARVGKVDSGDEIGRLAQHLDRLLQAIESHTRELDAKVAERTRALQDAQAQLVRNEKLAAVGQLTASIAHEVNNPIAVIQGNLDLVRELLDPAAAAKVATELKLVDEQVERMRLIVTQLLQFARPTEFAGYVDSVEPARVLEDCLVLVGHLLAKTRIVVQRDCRSVRTVPINRQELQQVLVNLLVNAVHAMPGGGVLELGVYDDGPTGARIRVADTGPGLPAELLDRLFQAFVTGRKEGTGLGLWICRSLVERYGGDITATNRGDGRSGAVFTVRLAGEVVGV